MLRHAELIVPSYAKINLGLYVLGKRQDGFHELWTIFQELEFHDILYFEKTAGEFSLTTDAAELSTKADNLICRAVKLLCEHLDRPLPVHIHLEKRIPLGAGLGGGSSNAASTLTTLNRLFDLKLSQDELVKLGEQLGSDVPFFLYGGTALATGRGEKIQPCAPFPPCWVALIFPGFQVSSAWAYKNLNLKLTKSEGIFSLLPQLKEIVITGEQCTPLQNTLEFPVIKKYPILQSIKNQLLQYGADWTLMSGSGSTVFGIFRDKELAEHALRKMEQPEWMMVVTGMRQRIN